MNTDHEPIEPQGNELSFGPSNVNSRQTQRSFDAPNPFAKEAPSAALQHPSAESVDTSASTQPEAHFGTNNKATTDSPLAGPRGASEGNPFEAQARMDDNAHKPMTKKQIRTIALIASAVTLVIALVAGAFIVLNVINGSRTPEAAVQEYANAIASGDAEKANKIVDPNVPTEQRGALTNEVLQSAKERITVLDVTVNRQNGQLPEDGQNVMASVRYRLGGVEHVGSVTVGKGPKDMGLFDTWKVTSPLVVEQKIYGNFAGEAHLGNYAFNLSADKNSTNSSSYYSSSSGSSFTTIAKVFAYPAIYATSTASSNKYLNLSASPDVMISHTDPTESTSGTMTGNLVHAEPQPELETALNEHLKTALDQCTQSTKAEPDGCPFELFTWSSDPIEVTWTIKEYPKATVTSPGTAKLSQGKAEAKYSYKDYLGKPKEKTETVQIYAYAPTKIITYSGGEPTIDLLDK